MIGNCHMCFKHSDIQSALPNPVPKLCKACTYKLNQVIGFLSFYGMKIHYQPELGTSVQDIPPEPPRTTRIPRKKESGDNPLMNPEGP